MGVGGWSDACFEWLTFFVSVWLGGCWGLVPGGLRLMVGGGVSEFVFEAAGEVGGTGEADFEGHVGDAAGFVLEQKCGIFQPVGQDMLVGGFICEGLDFFEQGGTAHFNFLAQDVYGKFGVGHTVLDDVAVFFQELVVQRGD